MPQPARRIALIGSINRDTIRTSDGLTTESYGGLLYSLLSLSEMVDGHCDIYPICNVGQDAKGPVGRFLDRSPNFRLDGLRFVPEPNNHCFLEYDPSGNKRETLVGGVPPLTYDRLSPCLDFDALCLNFITGFELSLDTLQRLRAATTAVILMDIHSLTLGIDENRRRFWRRPPNWEEWIGCADVAQMNEREAGLLWGSPISHPDELRGFGEHALSLGPSTLVITRGAQGSETLLRDSRGNLETFHTPADPPGAPLDETGCGDVFLMGFAVEYLRSRDVRRASAFANRVAGANACLRGIEEIGRIRDYLPQRP